MVPVIGMTTTVRPRPRSACATGKACFAGGANGGLVSALGGAVLGASTASEGGASTASEGGASTASAGGSVCGSLWGTGACAATWATAKPEEIAVRPQKHNAAQIMG